MPITSSRPCRRSRLARRFALFCVGTLLSGSLPAPAQIIDPNDPIFNDVAGVYVDPNGVLRMRETDGGKQLEPVRAKPGKSGDKQPVQVGADGLTYVSLPKLFAEVRQAVTAGGKVSDQLRHLGGLTQIRYVLVYPDAQDLVIAGPAETWQPAGLIAVGGKTGRPVMQLDDLVVAIRQGGAPFGCTIDPSPDSLKRAEEVAYKYARKPRKERLAALKTALGPQTAKIFGAPADTRTALTMLAADYRLKRMSLGAEKPPVAGLGYAVDDSRAAASRIWFEPSYEPLLVSADGNAYEFRGPRLQLKAGAFGFDPRGATPVAQKYADAFTEKMPQLTQAVTVFADLQNIADLNVLAALIKADRLDQKVGWDTDWLRSRDGGYPVPKVPVPTSADTVVAATGGSLVGGGVDMQVSKFVASGARQVDRGGDLLKPALARGKVLRKSAGSDAVMNAPQASDGSQAVPSSSEKK